MPHLPKLLIQDLAKDAKGAKHGHEAWWILLVMINKARFVYPFGDITALNIM